MRRVAWAVVSCALGACCLVGPTELEVLPNRCDVASCGPGSCSEPDGEALCACAPGWAAAGRLSCVELQHDAGAGCLSPEACGANQICERLTGRCLERDETTCETRAASPALGERILGDHCVMQGTAGEISGCGPYGPDTACARGLRCTPTGPFGHSGAICGSPEVTSGVCRRPCEPCGAADCGEHERCFFVADVGGVCLPVGFAASACGRAPCRPGSLCELGGSLDGAASGRCQVACSEEDPSCPSGESCQPLHTQYPEVRACR